MHGLFWFATILTVTGWLRAPAGMKVPAIWSRVMIVLSVVGLASCSVQSSVAVDGHSAPSSIRNLIGSVLPSTSGMSTAACFIAALLTMSTSANPSTPLWTITAMR